VARLAHFASLSGEFQRVVSSWFRGAEADDGEVAAGLGALFAVAEEEIGAAGGAEVAEEDILGVA
jgi:hypothetical protein